MHGLMQERALTLAHVFHRAETLFAHKTVSTAGTDRVTYAEWATSVRRLASALPTLGIGAGARVGTLASNHRRHLEVYFAAPITKRVLHTLNTRLSTEHLEYILGHAQDEVVFVDRALLPRVLELVDRVPVRHWVVMPDGTDRPRREDDRFLDYDELVAGSEPDLRVFEDDFAVAEENLASGLCYTSGTTGRPKGVVYTHRSTVLHCLGLLAAGLVGIAEDDVVMPIVPMFHANAWGLPYAAAMTGADLVLPGRSAEPHHLLGLMAGERVTVAGAVPTVWTSVEPFLGEYDLRRLRFLLGGGSVISPALSEAFRSAVGVPITHSWGMTEISPVGVIGGLRSSHADLDPEAQVQVRAAQGQPVPLVRLRIVDVETDTVQPWDGSSIGEVQAAGPWVASGYYETDGGDSFTADGWLRTGDLGTIDQQGYLRLVDRVKDLIKSGGEWISSVELEAAIASHPEVAEVAVIARPDPRWVERPVAFVVRRPGSALGTDELLNHISPQVAKWWLPDEIVFVDDLPKTGTGKLSKLALREAIRLPQGPVAAG